jgi:hypothetical protein
MLGLPKATEINKPLSKKAVFDKFKPAPADRKLFDEQITRLSIVAEISPQTMAVSAGMEVSAVYVILILLKTTECDQRNIALLSRLIDQRILFALQYENEARLAVYRVGKVFFSQSRPLDEWMLNLSGLDLDAMWVNLIAQIGDIDIVAGRSLDETIQENERVEKLTRQIEALEKKAMAEKQPRRKWEYAEEIKQLRAKLGGAK